MEKKLPVGFEAAHKNVLKTDQLEVRNYWRREMSDGIHPAEIHSISIISSLGKRMHSSFFPGS